MTNNFSILTRDGVKYHTMRHIASKHVDYVPGTGTQHGGLYGFKANNFRETREKHRQTMKKKLQIVELEKLLKREKRKLRMINQAKNNACHMNQHNASHNKCDQRYRTTVPANSERNGPCRVVSPNTLNRSRRNSMNQRKRFKTYANRLSKGNTTNNSRRSNSKSEYPTKQE